MTVRNLFLLSFLIIVSCKESEARRPVKHISSLALEKTVRINKRLFEKEQEQIQQYIALDSMNTYINSNKGFWYAYIEKNEKSMQPVKGDVVVFEQEIEALDGTVLYSKDAIGLRNYVVDKEHIIKGIKEGIKIMREGEKVKFLFSSFVAYRLTGDLEQIRGNEPIVSTIRLIKINN